MLPPVRCWTCNGVLPFSAVEARLREGAVPLKVIMDDLGIERLCCRRMVICHPPELEAFMIGQKVEDVVDESMNYALRMVMRQAREESTK